MPNDSSKYSEPVKIVLSGLFDYAGLFPPANREMSAALSDYVSLRNGEHSWVLGKFLLPVSRIDEFATVGSEFLPGENSQPISVSVTIDDDLLGGLKRVAEFNNGFFAAGNNVVINSLEFSGTTGSDILKIHNLLPSHLTAYFDVPLSDRAEELVEATALSGCRAKVQIAGRKDMDTSSASRILEVIDSCSRFNVPITVRIASSLQQADAEANYLNLFLAAAYIRSGMNSAEVLPILQENSPSAFFFDEQGITWQGFRLDLDQIKTVREKFFISFGVGSIADVVSGLRALNLLS
jgi:hypothetical protein